MKRFYVVSVTLIMTLVLLLASCGMNPNENTTDVAVTGDATEVGMRYAVIDGIVNLKLTDAAQNNLGLGIEMDTRSDFLSGNKKFYTANELVKGRRFRIRVTGLKLATTYYFRTFVRITPTLYYCGETSSFTTAAPDNAQHEFVDLALPSGLLWATCNVGANKPEEYGDYFAWGETTGYNAGKTTFDWANYKFYADSVSLLTKYCTDSLLGYIDERYVLEAADDAAQACWGGDWRTPLFEEWEELLETTNCTSEWTRQNGVYGRLFTSVRNGNTLFLPAAGYMDGASLYGVSSGGFYWSSSLYERSPADARILYFYSTKMHILEGNFNRCGGRSVRAVCP